MTGLSACNGIFDGIYDETPAEAVVAEGQVYVDASNWGTWNYLDLEQLSSKDGEGNPVPPVIVTMDIPREASANGDGKTGIYTYWFDVWGEGLSNNERQDYFLTDVQPEPEKWTIAIHREMVRTNGCGVIETNYTSFDDLPADSKAFIGSDFRADEWSETDVWVEQGQMLNGYVGCQGIMLNKVLSDWYYCEMPPPPRYTMNNHVFILRTKEGKFAALQLANHLSPEGTKCCFTINYRYPY